MAALTPLNALAEAAPGFVWRLTGEGGGKDADALGPCDDVVANLTVWESHRSMWDFTYRSEHLDFLRRRREWFRPGTEASAVLWWIPAGHRPSVLEGRARLDLLREHGPTPEAFSFSHAFDHTGAPVELAVA
ncbi:DUF3291 domain-containing protein [Streptomyces sp. NPDC013178]|uniref:DUF3291 domain-containing protein n=1 Tax=Streptomyces sp. NPDC013178 TaxID=3155118 RepID=UPI0033F0324C